MNKQSKKWLTRGAFLLLWLGIWQCIAIAVHNKILLAGPLEVLQRLGQELTEISFYQSVAGSLWRILAGFFLGLFAGMLLGALAHRSTFVRQLLEPLIAVMRSIPVASFVVLVLIWIGSDLLAIPIAFLVVFPNIYIHTISGLGQTDKQLLQMAQVCQMPFLNRLLFLYRPALLQELLAAVRISIGMAFKSGIAAEVIGLPAFSIGGRIYLSKLYLDTAGVLAFTIVIVLVSVICEKVVLRLLQWLGTFSARPVQSRRRSEAGEWQNQKEALVLNGVRKSYDGKEIFFIQNLTIAQGSCVGYMGASGCGKSTLFRLVMRLEKPDTGEIHAPLPIAAVFQEDRLCESENAVTNVCMTGKVSVSVKEVREELQKLLPAECLSQPVRELSGGMRRRVAIARACLSAHELLLMDEPFTGMDTDTRQVVAVFIQEKERGKTILFTSHEADEIALLGAEKKYWSF